MHQFVKYDARKKQGEMRVQRKRTIDLIGQRKIPADQYIIDDASEKDNKTNRNNIIQFPDLEQEGYKKIKQHFYDHRPVGPIQILLPEIVLEHRHIGQVFPP